MATTQYDQDLKDADSKSRVGANRTRREKRRKARKDYRAEKEIALAAGYSSTKILRKLKLDYKKTVEEINSNASENMLGVNDDITLGGIDSISNSTEEAVSSGLAGIEIIWADQNITHILASDLLDGYNDEAYWSLVLDVVDGVFDNAPVGGFTYDATSDIFEDDGATPPVQTKYRMRLITQYVNASGDTVSGPASMYGQYREVTTCINGEPFQRLTKVT